VKTALALMLALVMLTSCGIRKPLMKPKDIPAYEAKRERKKEQLEEDQQQQENSPEPSIEEQAKPLATPTPRAPMPDSEDSQ
jgi:hypothetical protein